MATDRDAYELDVTPARREMLEHVVRGRIYTWAGEPLRIGAQPQHERFSPEQLAAWRDLQRAGLVHGEHITGRGYRAADDWGLNPDANLKGRIR